MGIFTRKSRPVYTPLDEPKLGSLRLPDFSVVRRDSEVVGRISELAFKNIEAIDIAQWPTMERLEGEIIERISARHSDSEKMAFYASVGVRLGYITGILENKSGIAKDGLGEARYRGSLFLSWNQMQSIGQEYISDFVYCVESGYYVARIGELGISTVLANVHD